MATPPIWPCSATPTGPISSNCAWPIRTPKPRSTSDACKSSIRAPPWMAPSRTVRARRQCHLPRRRSRRLPMAAGRSRPSSAAPWRIPRSNRRAAWCPRRKKNSTSAAIGRLASYSSRLTPRTPPHSPAAGNAGRTASCTACSSKSRSRPHRGRTWSGKLSGPLRWRRDWSNTANSC